MKRPVERSSTTPRRAMLWRRSRLRAALFGVVALHGAMNAVAQESEASRLFREGRALLVEGRFSEGCPKLEESQRLEPRLGTELNVAFCHERLGRLATAWRAYQDAQSTAERESDVERGEFAAARARALEARVPRLELRVPATVDERTLTILLDQTPLPPNTWTTPQPLDPGQHSVVAVRDGREYWRATLVLQESEHLDLAIPSAPEVMAPMDGSDRTTQALPGTRSAADPRRAESRAAKPPRRRRLTYELALLGGYINLDTKRSTPDESPGDIRFRMFDDTGASTVTCADTSCEYDSVGSTAGVLVGASGLVSYPATPQFDVGLRFLVGARLGGGGLLALGPAASFALSDRIQLSPALLVGGASHNATGGALIDTPSGQMAVDGQLQASLGFSLGASTTIGWMLAPRSTSGFALEASPLFLYGSNGLAWALPVGVGYRWGR